MSLHHQTPLNLEVVVQSENVIIFSEKSVYNSIECALDARMWGIKKETNSNEMRFKESYH